MKSFLSLLVCAYCCNAVAARQNNQPVVGLHEAELRTHAIVNARVVAAPGEVMENAIIVIRDGLIEAVGETGGDRALE